MPIPWLVKRTAHESAIDPVEIPKTQEEQYIKKIVNNLENTIISLLLFQEQNTSARQKLFIEFISHLLILYYFYTEIASDATGEATSPEEKTKISFNSCQFSDEQRFAFYMFIESNADIIYTFYRLSASASAESSAVKEASIKCIELINMVLRRIYIPARYEMTENVASVLFRKKYFSGNEHETVCQQEICDVLGNVSEIKPKVQSSVTEAPADSKASKNRNSRVKNFLLKNKYKLLFFSLFLISVLLLLAGIAAIFLFHPLAVVLLPVAVKILLFLKCNAIVAFSLNHSAVFSSIVVGILGGSSISTFFSGIGLINFAKKRFAKFSEKRHLKTKEIENQKPEMSGVKIPAATPVNSPERPGFSSGMLNPSAAVDSSAGASLKPFSYAVDIPAGNGEPPPTFQDDVSSGHSSVAGGISQTFFGRGNDKGIDSVSEATVRQGERERDCSAASAGSEYCDYSDLGEEILMPARQKQFF